MENKINYQEIADLLNDEKITIEEFKFFLINKLSLDYIKFNILKELEDSSVKKYLIKDEKYITRCNLFKICKKFNLLKKSLHSISQDMEAHSIWSCFIQIGDRSKKGRNEYLFPLNKVNNLIDIFCEENNK